MPSRSVRRRHHKRQARLDAFDAQIQNLPDGLRREMVAEKLESWTREIHALAARRGGAAAREFVESPRVIDLAGILDPSQNLLMQLRRACLDAEAEAEAKARRLYDSDGRPRG